MSNKNTTPDTSTYVLPRGKMYFAEILPNGKADGFRFVGNVPEITATVENENYEHVLATQSLRIKDIDVILQQTIGWTASLENIDQKNLALFFSANVDEDTINPAITGFSDVTLVADGKMQSEATGGLWYQLYDASGHMATGITTANALSLSSTNATPVSLTLDEDYIVNSVTGSVFFLDSTKVQAIITGEEGVTATVTADAEALAHTRLKAGIKGSTYLAVKYEVIDAISNAVTLVFELHKAGISANGNASWVSDEITNLPLTISPGLSAAYDSPMTITDLR